MHIHIPNTMKKTIKCMYQISRILKNLSIYESLGYVLKFMRLLWFRNTGYSKIENCEPFRNFEMKIKKRCFQPDPLKNTPICSLLSFIFFSYSQSPNISCELHCRKESYYQHSRNTLQCCPLFLPLFQPPTLDSLYNKPYFYGTLCVRFSFDLLYSYPPSIPFHPDPASQRSVAAVILNLWRDCGVRGSVVNA